MQGKVKGVKRHGRQRERWKDNIGEWTGLEFAKSQRAVENKVNGQKLEAVTSFKYLGSVLTDEGSKPEILSRIAQKTVALTRFKQV